MKHLYLLALTFIFGTAASGQIVFESNFETWANPNQPDGWVGSKTNFLPDSIQQSSNAPTQGSYLVELTNNDGSHRRFTSTGISLMENQPYEVEVWVKGVGSIRTGLFDNDVSDNDFGYSYNAYEDINSTDVVSFVQVINPDTTYEECEVILSTIAGTLEIDRVEVRLGEVAEPTALTITQIQETTDPDGESPEVNTYVVTTGIVTAVADNGYYIQDGEGPWTGIRVVDTDNVPAIGDEVEVIGTVLEFFDFTRITDLQGYTNNGPGVVPNPTEVSTADANTEQYEGVLVRATGECIELPNQYNEWFIDDSLFPIMVNDEMYEFTDVVLGTTYQVTGPLNYAFSAFKIEPRDMDDVQIVSNIFENPSFEFSVFPNPTTDFITIDHTLNEVFVLQLIDAQGRLVMDANVNQPRSVIDLDGIATGYYTLILFNENKVSATKLEVK